MSHELFYTSAAKGVQPGARGFCTVALTKGMPGPLVEKVESLSGYRPLFPPVDAKAALNPIAYAHYRVTVANRTYSLLSRICAAGLDYSQRTNKFAHHVVLETGELPPGGPAWLLSQPGFMAKSWDGEVKVLPAARPLPRGDSLPAVCRAWQERTGDAGWAGVVAESMAAQPGRLVYLLFEPGMDLLPLLAEAVHLLPPEQRWAVTFSTYFTGLPQGVGCTCRGVPKDSAEAVAGRRMPGALVLDLSAPLGKAADGVLVERARIGQAARVAAAAPPPVRSERPAAGGVGLKPADETAHAREHAGKPHSPVARPDGREAGGVETIAPAFEPASGKGPPPAPPPPRWQTHASEPEQVPVSRLPGFVLGTAAGLLLAVGAASAFWFGYPHGLKPANGEPAGLAVREENSREKGESEGEAARTLAQLRKKIREHEKHSIAADRDLDNLRKKNADYETRNAELADRVRKYEAESKKPHAPEIHGPKKPVAKLEPPPTPHGLPPTQVKAVPSTKIDLYVSLQPQGKSSDYSLCDLSSKLDPKSADGSYDLQLFGLNAGGSSPEGNAPQLTTTSEKKSTLTLSLVDKNVSDKPRQIASFRIEHQKLYFSWNTEGVETEARKALRIVRNCVLEIKNTSTGKTWNIALRTTEKQKRIVRTVQYEKKKEPNSHPIPIAIDWGAQEKPVGKLYCDSFRLILDKDLFEDPQPHNQNRSICEIKKLNCTRTIWKTHPKEFVKVNWKITEVEFKPDPGSTKLGTCTLRYEYKLRDIVPKTLPNEKPRPRSPSPEELEPPPPVEVIIHSLVVYTKVNDLRVEVARIGE